MVEPAEFASRLRKMLEGETRLALGVSGGGDSMALLALVAAQGADLELTALTVDHRLRPEARDECALVGETCARLGVRHVVLEAAETLPQSNLQAAARELRYRLMRDWRRAAGIGPLALAHTQDDVAENFLIRLGRGSGVDGLARMSEIVPEETAEGAAAPRLRLLRPLLDATRVDLRHVCRIHNLSWVEDPSNDDPHFARSRARAALKHLAPLGLTSSRLVLAAKSMARARRSLEHDTDALLRQTVSCDRALGWLSISTSALRSAPEEIGLRALARCLRWVAGAAYPPRFTSLQDLYAELGDPISGRTLHGCVIAPDPAAEQAGATWLVSRESAAVAPVETAPVGRRICWDGRFDVVAHVDGLKIGALFVVRPESCLKANAPKEAFAASPAVWREGEDMASIELLAGPGLAGSGLADPGLGSAHQDVAVAIRPPLVS